MSISAISSAPPIGRPAVTPAADGDTAAQEARETFATKGAERLNGGFARQAASSPGVGTGKVDTLA
jgi:hypothetical protein